jgi:hypothetical protein
MLCDQQGVKAWSGVAHASNMVLFSAS